ncbi:MAG: radical SAM protein [Candidatus Margulisiibacteriota bacterium]
MLAANKTRQASNFLATRQAIINRVKSAGVGGAGDFHPLKLGLGLTDRCNSRCAYCSASVGPDGKELMSPEIMAKALVGARESGIPAVVLTGGEPTTRFETLLGAAALAIRAAWLLAIQTNTKMPELTAVRLFDRLWQNGWGSRTENVLQFNLSYALSRSEEEARGLINFVRLFGESGLNGQIVIEALHDQPIPAEEGIEIMNHRLGDRLTGLGYLFQTGEKRLRVLNNFPLMVGRAKVLREMPLGAIIRENSPLLELDSYRRVEQIAEDTIAVDPLGFVYPAGLYMYLGLYPIGDLVENTLPRIIADANFDPVLIMISRGMAGDLYRLAANLYPEFGRLTATCADPFEVIADILEEPDKALAIMDKAADYLKITARE